MNRMKLLAPLVAALMLVACGGGDTTTDATGGGGDNGGNEAGGGGNEVTVTAANFAFSPDEISVEPGEEVSLTFVNDDTAPHTFTSEDLGVDLKTEPGETATGSFTAPESGSVEWQCNIHPAMTGTITVGGDAAEKEDADDEMESDNSDEGSENEGPGY
jgi:plastocyanin